MAAKGKSKSSKAQKDLKPSKKSAQSVKGGVGLPDVLKKIRDRIGPSTPPPQ